MENDYKPKRAERLIARKEEESLLIFDSETGDIRVLNETAGLIWNSIDGNRSIKEIVEVVAKENPDEDEQAIEEDVLQFLEELQECKFIE